MEEILETRGTCAHLQLLSAHPQELAGTFGRFHDADA